MKNFSYASLGEKHVHNLELSLESLQLEFSTFFYVALTMFSLEIFQEKHQQCSPLILLLAPKLIDNFSEV